MPTLANKIDLKTTIHMKTLIKLATAFLIAILVFGSCTSQKELMYLSNLDTTLVEEFFPMERPGYKVQYQDILYVDIFTMNPEMNEYFLKQEFEYVANKLDLTLTQLQELFDSPKKIMRFLPILLRYFPQKPRNQAYRDFSKAHTS